MVNGDIVARIDAVIEAVKGCQRCGRPLGVSPSDDFCREECQQAWHAGRAESLRSDADGWSPQPARPAEGRRSCPYPDTAWEERLPYSRVLLGLRDSARRAQADFACFVPPEPAPETVLALVRYLQGGSTP
jgi:hypothetical protein